jgi:hypothetical protein
LRGIFITVICNRFANNLLPIRFGVLSHKTHRATIPLRYQSSVMISPPLLGSFKLLEFHHSLRTNSPEITHFPIHHIYFYSPLDNVVPHLLHARLERYRSLASAPGTEIFGLCRHHRHDHVYTALTKSETCLHAADDELEFLQSRQRTTGPQ